MIPTWLQRLFETTGQANTDGASRRARATYCRTCGAGVLRGLDHEPAGLAATVDPTPINALGEALALLGNRCTYSLQWTGDRYELNRRDQYAIAGKPAGTVAVDILAEHQCNAAPLPVAQYPAMVGPPAKHLFPEEVPY